MNVAESGSPRVGVIVVNWNSFDVLSKCLSALKSQSYQPYRTIVVDNNSDHAPHELECEKPDNTQYLRLTENTGFAHANNLAASGLSDCEWIALINPDAYPDPDWLAKLIDASRRRPEFSYFSSMTIMADEPEYLDGTGDVYHISGIGWRRGYERHIASAKIVEEEVFAPCAAAAMYRRDIWEEAGGFDEDFFCYFEDVDLAFRMRLLGYRCLFVPAAVAHHVGSITTGGQQSDFSVYYGHRNLVWTYIKDMPGYAFWLFLPLHIAMNLYTIARFVLMGRWRVIFRAKWHAIKGIKHAWRKRQTIQALRVASVSDVIRHMDHRVIPVRRPGRVLGLDMQSASDSENAMIGEEIINKGGVNHKKYFDYLINRSLSGLLYRRCCLYPKLSRYTRGRVLDVGCGIGDYLAYIPGSVGVDVNPFAVSWCKNRGLDVRQMDSGKLPFEDGSFDSVVLDNVLEHLSEPDELLLEISRVLIPGGRLVVGVPGKLGYLCDDDHKVFYDEVSLRATLGKVGLQEESSFYMPLKWDWLDSRLPQYCLYGVFVRD